MLMLLNILLLRQNIFSDEFRLNDLVGVTGRLFPVFQWINDLSKILPQESS